MPESSTRPDSQRRVPAVVVGLLFLAVAPLWSASTDEFKAALDSFTGEWKGEIKVHALDGYVLKVFEAERTYSWDGDRQIVETRFSDGVESIVFRDERAVQLGRLGATAQRPGVPEEEFSGELAEGGIVWTNVQRNNRDSKERILMKGETPAIEASGVEVLRLTGVSGLVRVTMHFDPIEGRAFAGTASGAEVARLQREVDDLQALLAEAENSGSDVARLRSERDELASQLSSEQSRATDLAEQVSALTAEKESLSNQLDESRARSVEATALAATIASLRSENAAAEQRVEELRRRLDESVGAAGETGALERERNELAEQLAQARSETRELSASVSALESERDDLSAQVAETGSSATKATALAATVAALEAKNAAAEKQVSELRGQTAAANQARETAQADAERFSARVDELTTVIREARAANDAATRQIEELDRTLTNTRSELETLRGEALGVIGERDTLAEQLATARKQVALASENESSSRELQRRLETVQAERDQQTARAGELQTQIDALRGDVERLRSGANEESVQVDQLKRDLAATLAEVESRDGEISRLRSQLATVEQERSKLEGTAVTIQELTAARDEAVTQASDLTRKLQALEAELASTRAGASTEAARARQMEAKLAVTTSGLETQTNEVTRLNARLAELENARGESASAMKERDALQARVAELEQELTAAGESASAMQESLEAKIHLLESRADITAEALEFERSENQRRYERAEGGRLDSLGRLTELEGELEQAREELALRDRQVADFKQTLASLEDTSGALESVRAKVLELEAAREEAAVQSDAERDQNRAQIIALEQTVDELKSVQTELGSLRSLAEQRQRDNENLVRRVDELNAERGQLIARISSLEGELASAPAIAPVVPAPEPSRGIVAQGENVVERLGELDRRVIELESERNSLRGQQEILRAQLKEASELRDGTLARFQDVVSQLNSVRKERDRLARANVSLEADLRAAQSQRTLVKSDALPTNEEGGILSRIITTMSEPESRGSPREIDRAIAGYEVIGVTASENGDKAILDGRVYQSGDVVDVDLGIVFQRVAGDSLVFTDESGREYRRRF